MSEYQVIARKWRPQRFCDVVGQEHIIRTLKNAIRSERTAHAYLFVGPRGVGKTTTARIFAKALNCTNPQDGEPCCECESCRAIAQDCSLDVIEIDAASRNSAEYMRELSEEVMHLPVAGRYKIYIIDEVHMLSKTAWNALLKTVEEPPPHIKFIFATTEAHQVLPTIVSRCQRFDLQPISTRLILDRLALIADKEGVKVSSGALEAIARAANGGMRDAQSLLDQMIAFFAGSGTGEISEKQVLELFGLTAGEELEEIVSALLTNAPGRAVSGIAKLAKRGRNLEILFNDILETLRGVELVMLLPEPGEVLNADQEQLEHLRRLAGGSRPGVVRSLLESLSPVGRILHDALNKQIFLETILLKAVRQAHAVKLEDILARLNQLRSAGELEFMEKLPPPVPGLGDYQPEIERRQDNAIAESIKVNTPPEATIAAPVKEPEAEAAAEPPKKEAVRNSANPDHGVKTLDGTLLWEKIVADSAPDLPVEWQTRLTNAEVEKYEDSTLTVKLPFDPADRIAQEDLCTIEAQLLSSMQNITGNWAGMLLLDYPEPSVFEPEEHLIEPEPEKVMPAEVDLAAPAPPIEAAINSSVNTPAPPPPEDDEEESTDDVDSDSSSGEEEETMPEMHSSLIGDPEEYRKACNNPAVRMIDDLFGGNVVEIHSI